MTGIKKLYVALVIQCILSVCSHSERRQISKRERERKLIRNHGKERDQPGGDSSRVGVARVQNDGDVESEETAAQRYARAAEISATGARLERINLPR